MQIYLFISYITNDCVFHRWRLPLPNVKKKCNPNRNHIRDCVRRDLWLARQKCLIRKRGLGSGGSKGHEEVNLAGMLRRKWQMTARYRSPFVGPAKKGQRVRFLLRLVRFFFCLLSNSHDEGLFTVMQNEKKKRDGKEEPKIESPSIHVSDVILSSHIHQRENSPGTFIFSSYFLLPPASPDEPQKTHPTCEK